MAAGPPLGTLSICMAHGARWHARIIPIVALVAAMSSPARAAGPASPFAALDGLLASFPGHASVVVADPRSAARFAWDEDRIVPAASLYKIGVMVEAYRQDAVGLLSLDNTTVDVTEADAVDDSYFTSSGTTLTVREAIERMITISENTPARALIRALDAHNVNGTLARLGLRSTRINTALPAEERTAEVNTTSARDMLRLFGALYHGSAVSPAASEDMLTVLARQQVNDRLPAGLPAGTVIAHKTGDLDGVAHDAGLIYTPAGPRIAVVLATDFASFDDVVGLDRSVASLVYGAQLDPFAPRFTLVAPPVPDARRQILTRIRISNAGAFAWQRTVSLSARLQASTSTAVETVTRMPLPLAAGSSLLVDIATRPLSPGTYFLKVELADEELGTASAPLGLVFTVE